MGVSYSEQEISRYLDSLSNHNTYGVGNRRVIPLLQLV